jgi:hypothetical protein
MKFSTDFETLFQGEGVATARLGDEPLYAVVDLIRQTHERPEAAEQFWEDLKRWEPRLSTLVRRVKMARSDGTWAETEMASLEQSLRILQSVPGRKAERIKLFLAESGRQRIDETADPELVLRRARRLYESRGYSREWIDKRLRGVSARHELTGQWYKRGATESDQFRALTNELMSGAFGLDVEHYRRLKRLGRGNLRDHMDDLELALTVLGETAASLLHKERDSEGFEALLRDTQDAGRITAQTREALEEQLGRSVVSPANRLNPGRPGRVSIRRRAS